MDLDTIRIRIRGYTFLMIRHTTNMDTSPVDLLAALALPQCNAGLQRRTITAPCALEVGPRFRCINPVNCGPNVMKDLTEIVVCGPNGIGICCPVISFHSPAGCGIRTPSLINPMQNVGYPMVPDAARQIAFTSFTQSVYGQRMATQRGIQNNFFGLMNRAASNANDDVYENSQSNGHRNIWELSQSTTSDHEIHYEVPLVHVSSQDTRARESILDKQRRLKKRSMEAKQLSGIAWSFPENNSKWNNETSDSSGSIHNGMEEYAHMAQQIEKLILQIGGMDVICKENPELAEILIVELNKSCPPAQSLNVPTFTDWIATEQERKSASFREEVKDSLSLRRNRREAKEEENDWKELYFLSREYLRKLLYLMVSEKPGEPLSHDSLSKLPLYPPFSTEQLQAIILEDPRIVDKNAASEIKKSGVANSKDSKMNRTVKSHGSFDFNFRLSDKNNISRIRRGLVSQPTVQLGGTNEQKGRLDGKFSDGSKVWSIRLKMAGRNNENETSEYSNGGIQTFQNERPSWRTGNLKNASLEGGVKVVHRGEQHGAQNAKDKVRNHESDEEEGPPLHVFHIKNDHKTDYSKMLKSDETINFDEDKEMKSLLDCGSEHWKAGLKGGNMTHLLSMKEEAIENKNQQVQLEVERQIPEDFLQFSEMAKDTTKTWINFREGNGNENKDAVVSAIKTENSYQGAILFRQGSADTDTNVRIVAPEANVHFTDQGDKTEEANIPVSLDETALRTMKENHGDIDFDLNLKGRSAEEKEDGDKFEFIDLPTEKSELSKSTQPPLAIHSNGSMDLLFNLRDGFDGNQEDGDVEFRSDLLIGNTAKHQNTKNNGENTEVRETIFKPTNSQQITEESKLRLTNDTIDMMKRPEVGNDSYQLRDLEGNYTEETVTSEDLKSNIKESFQTEILESDASKMGFNHKNHEGFIKDNFNLKVGHSFHVDGKNNENYESPALLNVSSQHDLQASGKSLLHHRNLMGSQIMQIGGSQKSVFNFNKSIELGNSHSAMEINIHTNNQKESDVKVGELSSDIHMIEETDDELSGYDHYDEPLGTSIVKDIDLFERTSGTSDVESSIAEKSHGSLNAEALSGGLAFKSEGKSESEIGDHSADHFDGETDLHSSLSIHFNDKHASDTSVALNDTVREVVKNVNLTTAEVTKKQESYSSNISPGDDNYKIDMETDGTLINVQDFFRAGSELKLNFQTESTQGPDSELSVTTLYPDTASDDNSQKLAISGGFDHRMIFKAGKGNLRLGLRIKRELSEPELSDPYDIFFHDNKSLPRPKENQDDQYYQLAAATLANWNISSNQNNSNLKRQTETKSKIVEKGSSQGTKGNLKHNRLNSIISLNTASELSKDTKRKHSKNAITKTHVNKKGKGHNGYRKYRTTKPSKVKNKPEYRSNKKHKKSRNKNKQHSPFKNTDKRHPKQTKQRSKPKKTHRKSRRRIRDLSSFLAAPTSEFIQQEYQGNYQNMKPKKTLNLRILYGKEETPYKPPKFNPFSDYNMPAEEDEFEKIVHLGYRKHLFNKGKFSVLHLTKNFKVYKPGEEESSEEDDDSIIGYQNNTSKRNPQFVIGGRNVEAPWPWMVGIYELASMKFVCGGTLLDLQHVVSAAHCFARYAGNGRFGVVIGNQFRWDKRPNSQPENFHRVKQLFIHEGFTMECYCNDIAILRLEMPLDSTHGPACIPHYDPAGVGEKATVLGWGDTSFSNERRKSGLGTEMLQRVDDLMIYPKEECRGIMSRIAGRDLPDNFGEYYICAGVPDGSKDACIGDSGGPLLHEDYDGMWSLIGVVSFGYKCAEPGVPGTYSRISYYIPWITKILATP